MNFISHFKRIDGIKYICTKEPSVIPIILSGIVSAESNTDEVSITQNIILINDFITVSEETDLLDQYKDTLYAIRSILEGDFEDLLSIPSHSYKRVRGQYKFGGNESDI